MYFYMNLSCEETNWLTNLAFLALSSKVFGCFWQFLLECLDFFSNSVGRFWLFLLKFSPFLYKQTWHPLSWPLLVLL